MGGIWRNRSKHRKESKALKEGSFSFWFQNDGPHTHACPHCEQFAGCQNRMCRPADNALCPSCWALIANERPAFTTDWLLGRLAS